MKRVQRKKLKQDEFVTTINRLVDFVSKHKNSIYLGIVLLVCVGLVIVGVRIFQARGESREAAVLGEIFKAVDGLEENPESVTKLEDLAGSGKFSRTAYIFLAKHWMEKGAYEKAEAALLNIGTERKDLFYYQGQDLLARIYIIRKDYDKAIEIYSQIEEEKPKDYLVEAVLYQHAEAHEAKGENEEALALYRRLQEEYAQSYYGYEASRRINNLEAAK